MDPENTTPDTDDERITVEEARAHFEAMGVRIVGPDEITIIS